MPQQETFDRVDQAIVRRPAKNVAQTADKGAAGIPDYERAMLQHVALCEALKRCGLSVVTLNPDPQFPHGSFVGDMAVVTENLAVISNLPDQNPRQGEQPAAATILGGNRFLRFVTAPGYFNAADVLRLGDQFYIGLSEHTNAQGAEQLIGFLKEFGYTATVLDISDTGIEQLSSAAAYLGRDRILLRKELAKNYTFLEYEKIIIQPEEKSAAGAFVVNGTLILPQGFPHLRSELRLMGIPFIEVNVSEFEKAGGYLSCLALRLPAAKKGNIVLMEGWREKAL